MNRDISTFIDPVIQDFIYQNGLYLRDTQDKPPAQRPGPVLPVGGAAGPPAGGRCHCWAPGAGGPADRHPPGRGPAAGAAPPSGGPGAHAGLAQLPLSVHSRPLPAFQNADLADQVRLRAGGKTLFITGLAAEEEQEKDYAQLLVSEVLSHALEAECVYAVFHPHEGLCPRRQRSSSGGRASSAGGGRWRPICGPRWCCSRIWRPPFRSPEPQPQGARRHPAGTPAAPDRPHRPVSRQLGPHPVCRRDPPPAAADDHPVQPGAPRAHHPPEAGEIYVRPLRQAPPGQDRPQHRHQDGPHRPGVLP